MTACGHRKLLPRHSTASLPVMGAGRLAFNPPSDNVQSPLASWHHPFDAACLGTDFVQQQARAVAVLTASCNN